jgi:hypothetical protein
MASTTEIVRAADIRLRPSIAAAKASHVAEVDDDFILERVLEQDGAV